MWWRHRGVWCDEYVCGVNSAMTAGELDVVATLWCLVLTSTCVVSTQR